MASRGSAGPFVVGMLVVGVFLVGVLMNRSGGTPPPPPPPPPSSQDPVPDVVGNSAHTATMQLVNAGYREVTVRMRANRKDNGTVLS